ncbi:type IV pilus modification PilV family protein [Pelovirga terrestris]|uniref:Prepilin-type N-terminal cleavage/methylation domain-containing protein n=1 Tax=Pelovirga terrestris TaxID=2771352 RepID=A0A8J6QT20_9BACT|nr:prepilin-type N-terminal cleavage/methylation domain-containing protein [Pelovirga terrestris]MBD1401410.1 prepilin-type N-terminal cleavage/methylation domain-containing protein [Pelovirga terrestris]
MKNNQQGLTLIELIVVMIVISVALVGVMSVINYTTRHSADPVLRHQAIAIAEAYMEEIALKEFRDPDTGDVCPAKEASRDRYDNVCDYNGLDDEGARNLITPDEPIEGLGGYHVWVTISKQRITADGFVADSSSNDALRIDVTVKNPAGEEITLTSYRTDY